MNRRADIVFFEPTTRYYLMQSVLNKKITNIYRNFKDEQELNKCIDETMDNGWRIEDTFCSTLSCHTIEFEGNISIDISRIRGLIMVKNSNRHGHKWYMQGWMHKAAQLSLRDNIFKDWEYTQIIGQKIVKINYFVATISKTTGKYLALELSNQGNVIFGNMDKYPFSNLLYISSNDSILKNLDKDELPLEVPNLDFEMLEDYWADPNELIDNEYIELYYDNTPHYLFTINTDIYWDKLSKKPIENYEILDSILSNIFQYQMGIMDLRFGLTKEGEIRLVKPIDMRVKRIFDNNVYFINSLMDTIYKMIPDELEKHYLK